MIQTLKHKWRAPGGDSWAEKPATAVKWGPDVESNGPAQSGQQSGRCCSHRWASGSNRWGGEGAASGRAGGLVSVGGPWEIGGAVWGAGPGPVLTMPGRSAYLGSAMAAARRGWGTEASVEPGPVTGWGKRLGPSPRLRRR